MPQFAALAAVPAVLGATGVALPAGLSAALTIIPSALAVAHGVIKKDPFAIGTGLLSGATAGLGGLAGGAAGLGSAAVQGATAGASLGSMAPAALSLGSVGANQVRQSLGGQDRGAMSGASLGGSSPAPSTSPLQTATSVLGGLATGASGVTSLIDALNRSGQHGKILGGIPGTNLPPAYGSQSGKLPGSPSGSQVGAADAPSYRFHELPSNDTLLQLLGAYRG